MVRQLTGLGAQAFFERITQGQGGSREGQQVSVQQAAEQSSQAATSPAHDAAAAASAQVSGSTADSMNGYAVIADFLKTGDDGQERSNIQK